MGICQACSRRTKNPLPACDWRRLHGAATLYRRPGGVEASCPILRNGIEDVISRPDLAAALDFSTVAVGTRVTSRPPHRSVRAAFPHTAPTSGINGMHLHVLVCGPAPAARSPGAVSGACYASAHSPWPPPFAPPTPQQDRSALFAGFTATMASSDFPCPCIIGYGSSPSRCGPSRSRNIDGQTWDLPVSDAILLHVMCS